MTILRNLLVVFVPLICFAVLPVPGGWVKDTIYPVRFYLMLSLAVAGSLALFFMDNGQRTLTEAIRWEAKKLKGLGLILALYCLWVVLSSVLSPMPGYSWLGHPYTQFGSILLLSCIAVATVYARIAPVESMIKVLALTTFVMALLTVLESLGVKPLAHLVQSDRLLYPAATVGHRPHLGGWFAIVALAPAFFYRERRPDIWFWLWLVSGLVGVGLSTTTSATLGVGAGLLLWLIFSLFQRKGAWKIPAAALALFVLAVGTLPVISAHIARSLDQTPPQLKNYGSTGSFKPRLYMWKAAWAAAVQRPVFGWGDDTFGYQVFGHLNAKDADSLFRAELGFGPEYKLEHKDFTYYVYRPDHKDSDAQTGTLLYIRPHSIILDELYSRGFVGFLLFLAVLISILLYVRNRSASSLALFLVAGLPYLIYLSAWFYVTAVTPLFFILMGTMLADIKANRVKPSGATLQHQRGM